MKRLLGIPSRGIVFLAVVFSICGIFSFPFLFRSDLSIVRALKSEAELRLEIEQLQKKLDTTKKQADSLSREISIIDQNVSLKEAQIQQAEYAITQKEKELALLIEDIRLLEVRVDRLDEKIDYHQMVLAKRIRERYIENQKPKLELFLEQNGISSFLARIEYMKKVEAQDQELLVRMDKTKGNYEDQQDLLKQKRDQVEAIKKEIEGQKAQMEGLKQELEHQKQQKGQLLTVTKNNETRYKQLLADAEKELAQIQSAANVVIREGQGVKVKKGETIGTMGNSGFSSGAHLHFGVYNYTADDFQKHAKWSWYYSNYVDPLKVLQSKTVTWSTGCYRDPKGSTKSGSGSWAWPMESVRLTQNFGSATCYNWMYGGKPHPALDMVGVGNLSVKSVDDGEAYFCRNCLKDGGNGVFVFHKNGKMSLYWHLK